MLLFCSLSKLKLNYEKVIRLLVCRFGDQRICL
ncbi:MAG: hypothetical protein JWQ85_1476 [Mucilaginibacter sp.]|nr:hypothetical protein [Mucilaginibacter sp.]